MDKLANQQEETGREIQSIISNYKKDSAHRKTLSYYIERLQRLERAWDSFESTDNYIRTHHGDQLTHPYFAKDYYEVIRKVYQNYADEFQVKISTLEKEAGSQPKEAIKSTLAEAQPPASAPAPAPAPVRAPATLPRHVTEETKFPTPPPREVDSQEISKITRRQKVVIESLHRLIMRLDSQEDQLSKQACEGKIATMTRFWSQIEGLHHNIYALAEDPVAQGYDPTEYYQLEELVEKRLVQLSEKLASLQATTPIAAPPANSMMKLPKIVLPKFDGDYLKWRQFYDLFSQMVHNQPLGACEKMWYLKTHLVGEAEKLIRHLSLSDENYAAAWNMLRERYDNHRLLVTALLSKLLSQPTITSEGAIALKTLHDTTQECLLGLENLGVATTSWDPLLFYILTRKLDKTTHGLYEQSLAHPKTLPSIKNFLTFLETRFQALETLGSRTKSAEERLHRQSAKSFTSIARPTLQCASCKGNHPLYACQQFLKMSPTDRLNLLKRANLCTNCLRAGHSVQKCNSRRCSKCSKAHNTLVHIEKAPALTSKAKQPQMTVKLPQVTNQQEIKEGNPSALEASSTLERKATTLSSHQQGPRRNYVILGTVVVTLVNNKGVSIECRAILDSGSQLNFISEKLAKELCLIETPEPMSVEGIGQSKQHIQRRVSVTLQSKTNDFSTRMEAFILPKITAHQPSQFIDATTWPIPHNIKLADPHFDRPGRIDFLIGAELFFQLMSIGQIKLADDLPTLQNTVLGWVVAGRINNIMGSQASCGVCTLEEANLNEVVERFWRLENTEAATSNLTAAEVKCEDHFTQTFRKTTEGRFLVRLPFAQEPSLLGESRDIAYSRFLALERKFSKNETLRKQYVEFMSEYIRLGHMAPIELPKGAPHYFIPHHAVLKPESSTTKLRVVFDASAKTSSNISLNDILHTGPTIQEELFSVLLRFRGPRYVFTADIEKMYRQIWVDKRDSNYQLILWRDQPTKPVQYYQLRTVTYGVTTAPYLAIRCLHQLATESVAQYPAGSKALRRDFYVDDLMTGSDSLSEALHLQAELNTMLSSAGFKLRKWCANNRALLETVPNEDRALQLEVNEEEHKNHIKTLGLTWFPSTDEFHVSTSWTQAKQITKRSVLSDIAHLFDPLGIMSPVVISAKIFLQKLWTLKLDWDAALPMEAHTSWIKFRESLQCLNDIKVPRHLFSHQIPKTIQLHVFCNASEKAYGAAVYVRSTYSDGMVRVVLLCAKSRVAPLKTITLPRLELCAAKLAASLLHRVRRDLDWAQHPYFLWTDSEIVLAWLNSSSSLHTFVANRVISIRELTLVQQWKHVPSRENPADLVSRGVTPDKLKSHTLWFHGPLFLYGPEGTWPFKQTKWETQLETKTPKVTLSAVRQPNHLIDVIDHRNSFTRLKRVIGYILRFIERCRKQHPPDDLSSQLSVGDLYTALMHIVKETQAQAFNDELQQIKRTQHVTNTSSLASLAPFIDDQGILRVGGRLEEADLPYDTRHPILLPYSHWITKLVMQHLHLTHSHAGPQTLLATTRQMFWPIKGKTIARSIVQNCVRCARMKPKLMSQFMGNLPARRVQPARPFVNAGVDFCGPLWIHFKLRGKRPQKCYIAVFCCFSTKAVHLEVVSDLTTAAFIAALRRFVSRRGNCRHIHCDNATNFVGARNQLTELKDALYSAKSEENITSFCSSKGISFHFIPPRAPHFGGLWEAAVKSAKHLLTRSVASASLTYEELETTVVEIEAILNSRPLTQLSTDPNDLQALTPGHFLIGEPLTSSIDPRAEPARMTLHGRWKLLTHLKSDFWRRWSQEYLHELQHRYKWKQPYSNVKPGMMVIIHDETSPPLRWQLGRIIEPIRGKDGLVRVADVKTAHGVLRRPIHKLAPLPIEEETPEATKEVTRSESEDPQASSTKAADQPRTSDESSPPKRSRYSKSSLLLTLFVCLIAPAVSNKITITPFKTQPGIYFEGIGTANLYSHEWNLVIYYDMTSYWEEFRNIDVRIHRLQRICTELDYKPACRRILDQLQIMIHGLNENNKLLQHQHTRQKRAPLNIIGNIASSLFGVLDSTYADKMSEVISQIEGNEHHLLSLIKNHTTVINSTANIVRKSYTELQHRIDEIDKVINRTISILQKEFHHQELQELFNAVSIEVTLMISNYQRMQTDLLDIVIDIHQGKINPQLLTPKQLQEQIVLIKEHLPANLRLPGSANELLEIYQLMTVKGRVLQGRIIVRAQLPLFSYEPYELLRVISVPVPINDTYLMMVPTTPYLIINLHRDQYYPVSEFELSLCTSTEYFFHVCQQHHPIYKKESNVSTCELELLTRSTRPNTCSLTQVKNPVRWIQLTNPNHWIYVIPEATTINVVCGTEVIQQTIQGQGTLNISSGCMIKEPGITIQAHSMYPSAIKTSYLPTKNLTEIITPNKLKDVLHSSSSSNNMLTEMSQLQELINQIHGNETTDMSHHPKYHIHHFTLGYIGIFASIAIISYLCYKQIQQRYRARRRPIPLPRSLSTADFAPDPEVPSTTSSRLNSSRVQRGEDV